MNKVISRLLIFFVGIPIIIGIVCLKFYNHLVLHATVCVVSVIAANELYNIFAAKTKLHPKWLVLCCTCFIPFIASLTCVLPAFGIELPVGQEIITYALIISFMIGLSFKSIGILFKGVDLTKTVSGPARITTMLGDTVKNGFSAGIHAGVVSTLEFLAILSISLFIMNLLPIPVLDGGLILFSFIECITKRRISPKVQFYVQLIGIAFILLLLALALTGDIQYFISQAKTK